MLFPSVSPRALPALRDCRSRNDPQPFRVLPEHHRRFEGDRESIGRVQRFASLIAVQGLVASKTTFWTKFLPRSEAHDDGVSTPGTDRRAGLAALLRHHAVRQRRRRGDLGPDVRGRAQRGHQLLRHRQQLQRRCVRAHPRPADQGAPGRAGRRHQVLQPRGRRHQRPRRVPAPRHPGGGGEPRAARHRSGGHPVPAPVRRAHPHRGADARAGGPRAVGEGALSRRQQLLRVADDGGPRRPGAPRVGEAPGPRADVQPREAPGRGGDPADGRGPRHLGDSLQPHRRGPALGEVRRRRRQPGPAARQQDVHGPVRG